jgi:uncharacterized protein (TIGR02145 family)
MNFFNVGKLGRTLLLLTAVAAVVVVGSVCLLGCGSDSNVVSIPEGSLSGNMLTYGGQTYKTVVIGGARWVAENSNYKTDSSWCYGNSPDSCAKYGRLYAWNAAKRACPNGWKLPNKEDWDILITAAGGNNNRAGEKLKAMDGWIWYNNNNDNGNGTDEYEFSALPGGVRSSSGVFHSAGEAGRWWTATETWGGNMVAFMGIGYTGTTVGGGDEGDKRVGYSVRCVQK